MIGVVLRYSLEYRLWYFTVIRIKTFVAYGKLKSKVAVACRVNGLGIDVECSPSTCDINSSVKKR